MYRWEPCIHERVRDSRANEVSVTFGAKDTGRHPEAAGR